MLYNDVYRSIPKGVRDPEYVSSFFQEYKLMPYSGTSTFSSHGILRVLFDLSVLSPSKEAVINFISRFAYEGDIDLIETPIPGLKLSSDSDSISDADKRAVAKVLGDAGIDFVSISGMAKRHNRDMCTCGNIYLQYEEINVGGSKRVELDYLHPNQVFYMQHRKATDPLIMAVFRYGWNRRDETQQKFEKVAVYPNFSKTRSGRKTIIHMANFIDDNDLYGRPTDMSALLPMYVEYCNNDLSAKVSKKEIVTKYILAFQKALGGPDSSATNEERARATRKILTRAQDHQWNPATNEFVVAEDKSETVAFLDYDGDKPPTPIKLDISRDSEWFNTQKDAMSNYIFVSNGVPKELAGFERSKGSLNSHSGEFILQQFVTTDGSLIRPKQKEYARLWNKVMALVGEFLGSSEISDVGIKFPAKIEEIVQAALEVDLKLNKSKRNESDPTRQDGGEEDPETE